MDKLSIEDLKLAFSAERTDHPGRRSFVSGVNGLPFGEGYRKAADGKHCVSVPVGEFIPNPPRSAGLRRVPKGMEVSSVEEIAPAAK